MTRPSFLTKSLTAACFAAAVGSTTTAPCTQGKATEDWSQTLMVGSSHLWGAMIGVDASDAIYVTGSVPFSSIVTAKLSPTGSVLWQIVYDNPGTREQAKWLAVDPFGDILVAGNNISGSGQSPSGFVILKYDPSGNLLWSDVIPTTRGYLSRVAADANGDVVVLGSGWYGTDDFVTIKYSRTGTRLWTQTVGVSPTSADNPGALAIDPAGNIYVTGGTIGTMLTIAYDPNGNVLWQNSTPAMGAGADLVLGPSGAVYVAGTSGGLGSNHVLVVKFDAAGVLQWANTYPGVGAARLGVDGHGDVVVTGTTSNGYLDWITHKLDAAGTLFWSTTYNQHRFNDEVPYGLTIGPDDEIYVTGQGGPGPTSGNLSDLRTVTVRYTKDGSQDWAASSFTSLRGRGVARLSNNSIAVVGESTFTVFHYAQTAIWSSVGGAIAGGGGVPHLEGKGSPRAATAVTLELSRCRPAALAALVVGGSQLNLPLLGGVLVPTPDLILNGLTLSGTGTLSVPLIWPSGLPPAFEIAFQVWMFDAAGPFGVAASNGLLGISE